MVRSELLAALVRENPGLSPDEVSRLIDTFFDAISGQLAQGGRVELRGFGVFTTKERAATLARNPFTGDRFLAPGRNVAHFKPALAMGRRLNPEKSHQTTPDTGDT
jgi:integration host factor subunit beta